MGKTIDKILGGIAAYATAGAIVVGSFIIYDHLTKTNHFGDHGCYIVDKNILSDDVFYTSGDGGNSHGTLIIEDEDGDRIYVREENGDSIIDEVHFAYEDSKFDNRDIGHLGTLFKRGDVNTEPMFEHFQKKWDEKAKECRESFEEKVEKETEPKKEEKK
ncbi:hypothetical protein GOV03_00405 [Candidatus Woesearchaeota archaeon]|nr:hypothetical protein [Candidatus Woesearchaeota archaeon]